ncbi:MAG: hypothetical protein H0U46_06670, partial [Actinobacteria bacterium]|nr:hypothetical protein [Actinomycetota bacterium]
MPSAGSVAMTEAISNALADHLRRPDGQEDLCFGLYRPSRGEGRFTALVVDPIFPEDRDRRVHGNVEFQPSYFDRVLQSAVETGMGIAFLHSHPLGVSWQGMSPPDVEAETGMAAAG